MRPLSLLLVSLSYLTTAFDPSLPWFRTVILGRPRLLLLEYRIEPVLTRIEPVGAKIELVLANTFTKNEEENHH